MRGATSLKLIDVNFSVYFKTEFLALSTLSLASGSALDHEVPESLLDRDLVRFSNILDSKLAL